MKRMTKLSAVSSALAMAGALAFSGQVFADTVTANYTGVSPRATVGVHYTPTGLNVNAYAGSYNFDNATGPINMWEPGKFASLCVDLVDDISESGMYGNPQAWDVVSLAATPNAGSGQAMGVVKADQLARLLGGVLGTDLNNVRDTTTYQDQISGINDNQLAAALQVATWEIVWEDSSNSFDLGKGDLTFSGISGNIAEQANSWLTKVGAGTYGTAMQGLVGLTSPTDPPVGTSRQDFVGQVPIPAAAWLFGSALIGAVGLGRRKPTVAA